MKEMQDAPGVRLFYTFCVKEQYDTMLLFWNQARHFQRGGESPAGDLLNEYVGMEPSLSSRVGNAGDAAETVKIEAETLFYTYIAKGAPSEVAIQPMYVLIIICSSFMMIFRCSDGLLMVLFAALEHNLSGTSLRGILTEICLIVLLDHFMMNSLVTPSLDLLNCLIPLKE